MKRVSPISIITLTRDRAGLLALHLGCLRGQLKPTDEIIVIDNQSVDETPAVLDNYKKELPLRIFRSALRGYPALYNLAISKARGEIVIFLDDDCTVGRDYLLQAREAHHRFPQAVIQGMIRSLPEKNIFAEISQDHVLNWLRANLVGKNRLKMVDNKNLLIPRSILVRYGGFSESMSLGSEDVELGQRLYLKGVPIIWAPRLLAYHHERTSLGRFLLQHYRIAKSHALYNRLALLPEGMTVLNRIVGIRHLASAWGRAVQYARERRYKELVLLPLIYGLLFSTRLAGFVSAASGREARS